MTDKSNTNNPNKSKKSRYNYYDNYLHINPADIHNNHAIKFIPQQKLNTSKPVNPYNTRYQKRQRMSEKYQQNLKAKLTPTPEPLPINHPQYLQRETEIARIRKENADIIKFKPSNPTYNKELFVPSSLPINDDYDINELSNDFIQQKQSTDAYLFPIIEYLKNNNKYLLSESDLSQ